MGLHAIAPDASTISMHCMNPECEYHNCANWEDGFECAHHDELEYITIPADEAKRRFKGAISEELLNTMGALIIAQKTTMGRKNGKTRTHPVDHPEIQFTGPHVVSMPMCECGTQMFVKVNFTARELQADNIQIKVRDPQNPSIIREIRQHPMVPRHQALGEKLRSMGRVYVAPKPGS